MLSANALRACHQSATLFLILGASVTASIWHDFKGRTPEEIENVEKQISNGGEGLDQGQWLQLAVEAADGTYGHWCRPVKYINNPGKEEHGAAVDTVDLACQEWQTCQLEFTHPSCECGKQFMEDLERAKTMKDPVLMPKGNLYREGQLIVMPTRNCFCKLPDGSFVKGKGGTCKEAHQEL